MEQLIAQLAQAMAQGQGASFNPEMMAQAGGATNVPMDPASAQRLASELASQGQPTQNTAQQGDRFQYSAPIDPAGDEYFKDELGQDYESYMQMTPDQRLQYLNDPANGFVPPLY